MSEKPLKKLSRRDMLKLSGTAAAGALLASCASPTPEPTEEAMPEEKEAMPEEEEAEPKEDEAMPEGEMGVSCEEPIKVGLIKTLFFKQMSIVVSAEREIQFF